MNKEEQIYAKALNNLVTQNDFVDKDTDNYLYASLSQPPIKIINKNNSDNCLDYTVECPNCGRYVNYGEDILMISGYLYCNNDECKKEVYEKVGVKYE